MALCHSAVITVKETFSGCSGDYIQDYSVKKKDTCIIGHTIAKEINHLVRPRYE